MAKKVKFELNLQGLNELMKSAPMQAALQEAGDAVAQAAGDGFAARTDVINYVAITNVYADTNEAKKKNLEDNALLKGVGAVGLPTSKG